MSNGTGTRASDAVRNGQRGAILLGLAGGLLIVAGGFAAGYFVLGARGEARAATTKPQAAAAGPEAAAATTTDVVDALLAKQVAVKTASGTVTMTWAELGVEADLAEAARSPVRSEADVQALAARGSLPVRIDRDKAVAALVQLKARHDKAPANAYLDLEARTVQQEQVGQGLDVWGSIPRIIAAARQASPTIELLTISMPANVTRATLGIDDISQVMGHYVTRFPVVDRDRNFNLKLAASKINGAVLRPGEEWSFNDTVGERSQKMGYKIAHVITAGEMVDGLAGGTCQISTTLFGASFFAGLDIVKSTNHSRPSTYTPLAFDATVVWPNTDLKLRNPYDFPVALRYVVANGEAKVEVLGRGRPYDKVVFERKVIESTPFSIEERLDDEMPMDETRLDQVGFDGYKLERFRKFYKNGKVVKTNKWVVTYKPVTEYIRRGINPDPNIVMKEYKEPHGPKPPSSDTYSMKQ